MKIAQVDKFDSQSNSTGRTIAATIDPAQMGMLMDMLSRNYNDPYAAVLREYVANGYDSHKAANVSRPVEVTVPTEFSSVLKIQDFGVGLSASEIEEVYSVFGASTKRMDNLHIGGFGIGSKSALAISDQFTVSSTKNGSRSIFVVSRVNNGIDYKFMVEDQPSDDVNGVTITIPVSNATFYNPENISRVLGGWSARDVKVVNRDVPRFVDDWIKVESGYVNPAIFEEDVYARGYNHHYGVNVGPVYYPNNSCSYDYDFTEFQNMTNRYFVADLEIGSVTFPSSREVIEDNFANREVIKSAFVSLFDDFKKLYAKRANSFDNLQEAITFYHSFARSIMRRNNDIAIEFNGEKVPSSIDVVGGEDFIAGEKDRYSISSKSKFSVLINDSDYSYSTVTRGVKDYQKFHLDGVKAVENIPYVLVLKRDNITDTIREIAVSIDNYENVREKVIKARKEDRARKAAEKKVTGVSAVDRSMMGRKIFVFHRETTLGNVLNNYTENKIFIGREEDEKIYDLAASISSENFKNSMFVAVSSRVAESTINKYSEILNATIVSTEWVKPFVDAEIENFKNMDDIDTAKKFFNTPLSRNSTLFARIRPYLKDDTVEKMNDILKKVEDVVNFSSRVSRIDAENVYETLGFSTEKNNRFAMLSVVSIYYGADEDAVKIVADYVEKEFEKVLND